MRLFGGGEGPHMAHFHCAHSGDEVKGWWEVRNCERLQWRVLRSGERFADSADTRDGSQTLVVEGDVTHFSDPVAGRGTCYYTVFSQEDGKGWERQAAVKINAREHLFWHHPDAERQIAAVADNELNPQADPWRLPLSSGKYSEAIYATVRSEGVAEWLHAES